MRWSMLNKRRSMDSERDSGLYTMKRRELSQQKSQAPPCASMSDSKSYHVIARSKKHFDWDGRYKLEPPSHVCHIDVDIDSLALSIGDPFNDGSTSQVSSSFTRSGQLSASDAARDCCEVTILFRTWLCLCALSACFWSEVVWRMSESGSLKGVGAGSRRTPCLCVTVLRSSIAFLDVAQFSVWRSLGVLFGELCVGLGLAVCQGKRVQRIHMHHPLIQHTGAVVWRGLA